MAAVRHLGFVMCMFGPSMTSISWQNLVGIDAVVSIITCMMQVLIFNEFVFKIPIHTTNGAFWGGFNP